MESASQVVELQKRKRSNNVAVRAKSEPASKRTRQAQPKYKSPLLKIYQETVVSVDVIKDLGIIQHRPHHQGKQLVTVNFKYRRHEPIVIIVNQDELKTVTKRIRESVRKYAPSTQEGEPMNEDEEDEAVGTVRPLELEMQMQMHEDLDYDEGDVYTPDPNPSRDKKRIVKTVTTAAKKSTTKPKKKAATKDIVETKKEKDDDDDDDDLLKDSDSSLEEERLHSPEPR